MPDCACSPHPHAIADSPKSHVCTPSSPYAHPIHPHARTPTPYTRTRLYAPTGRTRALHIRTPACMPAWYACLVRPHPHPPTLTPISCTRFCPTTPLFSTCAPLKTRLRPVPPDVDVAFLLKHMHGFSCIDITNICQPAAKLVVRKSVEVDIFRESSPSSRALPLCTLVILHAGLCHLSPAISAAIERAQCGLRWRIHKCIQCQHQAYTEVHLQSPLPSTSPAFPISLSRCVSICCPMLPITARTCSHSFPSMSTHPRFLPFLPRI